jgi:hypothetical protein
LAELSRHCSQCRHVLESKLLAIKS